MLIPIQLVTSDHLGSVRPARAISPDKQGNSGKPDGRNNPLIRGVFSTRRWKSGSTSDTDDGSGSVGRCAFDQPPAYLASGFLSQKRRCQTGKLLEPLSRRLTEPTGKSVCPGRRQQQPDEAAYTHLVAEADSTPSAVVRDNLVLTSFAIPSKAPELYEGPEPECDRPKHLSWQVLGPHDLETSTCCETRAACGLQTGKRGDRGSRGGTATGLLSLFTQTAAKRRLDQEARLAGEQMGPGSDCPANMTVMNQTGGMAKFNPYCTVSFV
ncbi:unnamed protein product [Protopolystoma xenopodis]|uniref:Uncharacterized protein n=1 Tax=Protopolystoma xenopodis TaxID=117903 RepID=A0A448WXJ8_9PLAT|nr:unnamed protein product [Protopolystoma xenopodis]